MFVLGGPSPMNRPSPWSFLINFFQPRGNGWLLKRMEQVARQVEDLFLGATKEGAIQGLRLLRLGSRRLPKAKRRLLFFVDRFASRVICSW